MTPEFRRSWLGISTTAVALVCAVISPTVGADEPVDAKTPIETKKPVEINSPEQLKSLIDGSVDSAISFLKNRGQADDGRFSPESGIAVTALCVRAILDHRPTEVNSPQVRKALDVILANVRGDGGIYSPASKYRNYETSVAVSALVAANDDNRFESELKRAEVFLKRMQWDEGEGIESSDESYGGAGYAKHGRPDLSNTSYMLDALRDLGNDAEDEAIQKALRFVSRTQNLNGHGNDTEFAGKQGDGGFYYTPAAGGESKVVVEGDPENQGGLRSYGSMTYAGLKSMIYAGLTRDDPRVAAAMGFIQRTYSLTHNPGMGQQGLYYYYHTFAKALDVADIRILTDTQGVNHQWNRELAATLLAAQQEDGSWVNHGHQRWMEGDRNLVTAYALLALAHCRE